MGDGGGWRPTPPFAYRLPACFTPPASPRHPAFDGAQSSQGGGFFRGAARFGGSDTGQDDEAAALGGLDGSDVIGAPEELGQGDALKAQGDVIGGLGGGSQDGAGGGPGAAVGRVDFGRFTAEQFSPAAQPGNAGHAGARLVHLEGLEDEEAAAAVCRCGGGVQFSSRLPIGVRLQSVAPAWFRVGK